VERWPSHVIASRPVCDVDRGVYPFRRVCSTRPTIVPSPGPVTFSVLVPVPTAPTPSDGIRYTTMPAGLLVVQGPK
jgi:hypothetical protein